MLFIYFLMFLFILSVSETASVNEYRSYKNYKMYEIEGVKYRVEGVVKFMSENYEIPFHHNTGNKAQMLVAPELVPIFETKLSNEELSRKIIIDDYSEIIREEKSQLRVKNEFSWTSYYDVDNIYNYLENTSNSYPNWTQVVVGGESYEGRKIKGLRINTPTDEEKPVVFIESGIHAREWITPATTTYFINQLLTSNDPKITALRDQFDWRIFPTVNPDGYHHSFYVDRLWRKTRSKSPNGCFGADPNRNWDYNWLQYGASNNPCDYQTYGGSSPFSEIETRTLSAYISSIENMIAYIAFHSDAQMLLLPYSDSTDHVHNYEDLVTIGKTSLNYGRAVNGEKYRGPATAAEILYKASGGSMDWVRNELATPLVYTYELRGTYFHWPPQRINEQGDEVTQMLLGFHDEARNLGYF